MTSYWIVVPRGNSELFDLLSFAFRGRSGFTVILDRRTIEPSADRAGEWERRTVGADLGPDEFIVVERAEQAVRSEGSGATGHRSSGRIPVIRSRPRGRVRRPTEPARSTHAARPPASLPMTR
jgi:hypothetical protein